MGEEGSEEGGEDGSEEGGEDGGDDGGDVDGCGDVIVGHEGEGGTRSAGEATVDGWVVGGSRFTA